MKTIGITGGSGFVGTHLSRQLISLGHSVVVFTRGHRRDETNIHYAQWDPEKKEIEKEALASLDAIVHLAGAGVADKRWTAQRKQEIISSRVCATEFLIEQLRAHSPECKAFVAASATGFYGPDRGGEPFTEDDPPFDDFLARVCAKWEEASLKASDYCRTAIFRFGIVLGKDGGAYPELSGPMKFGVMPVLGSGKQIVSWVHVEDIAGMIRTALEHDNYSGRYNAVAPNPVSHRALMKAIAEGKGGMKIPVRVPPFVLNLIMGEASVEVLKSCTVSCEKVQAAGYHFRYERIDDAVRSIESDGKN